MNETEFAFFQWGIAIIETFVYAGCLLGFFFPFLSQEKKYKGKLIRKCIYVYGSYVIMSLLGIHAFQYGWLFMIGAILILSIGSGVLDLNTKFAFWLSVLFFHVYQTGTLIANSVYYILNTEFLTGKEGMSALSNIAYAYVIADVVQLILTRVMLGIIGKRIRIKPEILHRKEWYYLSLFPMIGLVFGEIVMRLLVVVKDGVIFGIYEEYPVFLGVIPLLAILFYVGTIATMISYQKMLALQEERNRYFVEQQQLHALQERTKEIEQYYQGIHQIKHEIRNHVTNIKGLAENENYEEMKHYISQMEENLNTIEQTMKTGNAVTDVIVNDKKKMADKLGIEFQSDFSYPFSEGYNAYDIGIILNNLLINAIEACEKICGEKKYVILSGKQKKKFFLIEVKNSFQEEINIDEKTKLPISTKKKDNKQNIVSLHGIGLSNVKHEVEKYMGDMDIKINNNEFCITVLLQEQKNENDKGGTNYEN